MKKSRSRKIPAFLFTVFVLVVFTAPIALLAVQSFSGRWTWPGLLPQTWGLRAWRIFGAQAQPILKSLFISMTYSLAAAVLSLILCYMPAAALVRGNLANRSLIETLFMAPVMAPPIAFTLGIHHVFISLGLADRWLGVVLVLTVFFYPYMLRALMGGFEVMGEKYSITARNIGAGPWRCIWEIELPLLIPAIVSGGSIVFLAAFSSYYLVFLIGGGAVSGYSGYLFPFLNSSDRPAAALLSLLFLALPLLLFGLVETAVSRWYRRRGMEPAP